MAAYFLRRLLLIIPTFFGVTIVAFAITRMVPGGPFERAILQMKMGGMGGGEAGGAARTGAGTEIPAEALEELKRAFDLDKPGYIAYFLWLDRMISLPPNLGHSYTFRLPVWDLISERFPISLYFGLTGFILAYLISIPLGIAKALRHGSHFDFISSAIVFVGYSIPGWALGTLLLVLFAGGRFPAITVFPLGGFRSTAYDELPSIVKDMEDLEDITDEFGSFEWERLSLLSRIIDQLYHTILPIFCYTIAFFAPLTILTKNSLMENLGQDYVRTAFAKGLRARRVIFVHTLRNSLIPLATGLGNSLGLLMAGSYLIEWVFNIDGIGYLGYTSIVGRDYTVVMGVLSINTLLLLLGNILSDFLYALIDPRIRFE